MPKKIKTRIHQYRFNVSKTEEAEAYRKLCEELRATPGRAPLFNAWSGDSKRCELEGEVWLETEHLFQDQWNTAAATDDENGWRVFDWYEGIVWNRDLKQGHYLEITDEMREIRRNTLKCGFCWNQKAAAQGYVFCPDCLGSAYLKRGELFLLRLLPVESLESREELTEAERAHLEPLYVEAQTRGDTRRAAKKRVELRDELERRLALAQEEHDGKLWLLENGVNLGNVIFYKHTGRFCFGWRNPVSQEVYSELLDVLCEFPFDYDIKRAEVD